MRRFFPFFALFVLVFLLSACTSAEGKQLEVALDAKASSTVGSRASETEPPPSETPLPPTDTTIPNTDTEAPASTTPSPAASATLPPSPTPTLATNAWMEMPAVPALSDRAREIYLRGLEMGNDPHAFSKVGDCQNVSAMFLAIFDAPERYYRLGEYEELKETIEHFSGSWERESLAVRGGFNAATMVSPLRADPKFCNEGETPLACEYRLHNPSIAIISLETWWSKQPAETYEKYMRQIIEYSISEGVLPILATKADNLEGDHSINATIARLAYEYEIPLWNFWNAVQPLPNHGLRPDNFHLTFAGNFFDDPVRMRNAWPVRNLTALQSIHSVWTGTKETPEPTPVQAKPTAQPETTEEPAPETPAEADGENAQSWQDFPVIPTVSEAARQVYLRGQELGNNPQAFSKIGDCGSTPAWFLGAFDDGPRYYSLGEYTYLEDVIDHFQGSFGRTSLAAKSGFNASSIFAPIWSSREYCAADEAPLSCEYRVQRPAFAFIMLGTNDVHHQDTFEEQMRKIIELSMDQGVIPILSTKADNLEGNTSINATIAALAEEYGMPLVNFWKAVQPLPDRGLQSDGAHLTWAGPHFDDEEAMENAWPVRNLISLQALDAVWRGVTDQE